MPLSTILWAPLMGQILQKCLVFLFTHMGPSSSRPLPHFLSQEDTVNAVLRYYSLSFTPTLLSPYNLFSYYFTISPVAKHPRYREALEQYTPRLISSVFFHGHTPCFPQCSYSSSTSFFHIFLFFVHFTDVFFSLSQTDVALSPRLTTPFFFKQANWHK